MLEKQSPKQVHHTRTMNASIRAFQGVAVGVTNTIMFGLARLALLLNHSLAFGQVQT